MHSVVFQLNYSGLSVERRRRLRTTCPEAPRGGNSLPSSIKRIPPAFPTLKRKLFSADHWTFWPGWRIIPLTCWPSMVTCSQVFSLAVMLNWCTVFAGGSALSLEGGGGEETACDSPCCGAGGTDKPGPFSGGGGVGSSTFD